MEEQQSTILPPEYQGLTFDKVWAMFQAAEKRFEETERLMKEQTRETDRQFRETDRQFRETDRQFRETDRKFRETDRRIGELGNRFGELAEHLVTPNIAAKFRALGYAFTKAGPNLEFFDDKGKSLAEVDVWLENGEFAMAVEVKSYLRIQDVRDHLKRMEALRCYFDAKKDTRKLLGAAAGAIVRERVRDYVAQSGFYLIEQSGDTVKIEVPEGFRPRIW
jgi:hypothetical protein